MPTEEGVFTRIWKFVDQFISGDEITRADLDISLDDVSEGINAALTATKTIPVLAEQILEVETALDEIGSVSSAVARFAAFTFDDLNAFTDDRNLTYEGDGDTVEIGDYISIVNFGVLQVAAQATSTSHYQTDNQTAPVKAFEAGLIFTSLHRFKQAVARDEEYLIGDTVLAGGVAYDYLGDGNTNLEGLTGWKQSFLLTGSNSDLTDSTEVFRAFAKGVTPPVIGDVSVTDFSINPGHYSYSTTAGSSNGPASVTQGNFTHLRRAAGGGEVQICYPDAPSSFQGRIFTRSRTTGAWSTWRRVLNDSDVVDEDDLGEDSEEKLPTQQSVKAYVDALPFRRAFSHTGDALPSADTDTTKAHGLGVRPTLFHVALRCVTTDLGYAVGDEVIISPHEGSGSRGFTVWANTTAVGFVYSDAIYLVSRSGSGVAAIDNAKWELVYRAWSTFS